MKYNGRLAVTAFICGTGSILLAFLSNSLTNLYGTEMIAGTAVADSVLSLLQRMLLVPLIIAFFKQSRVLNYIAIGIEMTIILLIFFIPETLLMLFSASEVVLVYGIGYLRMTAVILFVLAGLCVLFGFVIRGKRMMVCFIMAGAANLLSVFLLWLMMNVFSLGATGAAFRNITQPFSVLLPLLMLNPDRETNARKPMAEKIQLSKETRE